MRKLARFLALGTTDQFVLYNACDVLPADLRRYGGNPAARFPYREAIQDEARCVYPRDPVRQAMFSDQHTFLCSILDRNDRMTMGASIECRVPFLDVRLVEAVGAMPTSELAARGGCKRLLRAALGDRLPADVLHGRKWGFAVPWSHYFRKAPALRALLDDLPDLAPVCDGPLDRKLIRSGIERFCAGQGVEEPLIRQLAMIAIWYRACCGRNRNRRNPPQAA